MWRPVTTGNFSTSCGTAFPEVKVLINVFSKNFLDNAFFQGFQTNCAEWITQWFNLTQYCINAINLEAVVIVNILYMCHIVVHTRIYTELKVINISVVLFTICFGISHSQITVTGTCKLSIIRRSTIQSSSRNTMISNFIYSWRRARAEMWIYSEYYSLNHWSSISLPQWEFSWYSSLFYRWWKTQTRYFLYRLNSLVYIFTHACDWLTTVTDKSLLCLKMYHCLMTYFCIFCCSNGCWVASHLLK